MRTMPLCFEYTGKYRQIAPVSHKNQDKQISRKLIYMFPR